MKSIFNLKEFNILTSKKFSSKSALIVVQTDEEIPEEFKSPYFKKAFANLKKEESKLYSIEGQYETPEKLGILKITYEKQLAGQVAEAVRGWTGDIDIFVAESLDINEVIFGFGLGIYNFSTFKTPDTSFVVPKYTLIGAKQPVEAQVLKKIESIYLARDLVNMPSNHKNPKQFTELIASLPWKRTKIHTLNVEQLEKEGFGMLLSVAAGSGVPASVVVFERSANTNTKEFEVGIIGKGVTFDAGGLQIKPDDGMFDMKLDMAGAAATLATFWYIDSLDTFDKNIVGAVGLVENMLGENAVKPLDIVRAHNGLTVEIHHTDAEGRLVLGDLASYISSTYTPKTLISIATLTGACMAALGYNYAGLISKNVELSKDIKNSTGGTHEQVWELPLDDTMLKATHADIADRKNLSRDMKAGASMGAAFIAQFVNEKTEYAHLDIAGPSYRIKAEGIFPAEGTGFGTETLIQYVLK